MTDKKQIEKHRAEKDRFFKKHPNSPLPQQVKKKFTSLDYYPIKEEYSFKLPLQKYDDIDTIEMETNDNQLRQYKRIGYLKIELNDESTRINVYQSVQNPDHYFVPFRDETSGDETYGAGRYLDPDRSGDTFVLDFNQAYNPFCAYSDAYSCPLPPMENWLEIPIKAGEKSFEISDQ